MVANACAMCGSNIKELIRVSNSRIKICILTISVFVILVYQEVLNDDPGS